ncbi:alpha/beta hydrolase [Aspergillus pseudocaelatus]|uniref:Alpha/beta hydrolase n=1 Tax=Aspergillus pseudocaelatus TaxID=1825620 RepID=A0ABQ6X3W5_9EURO|nr:alpha/beta hydrolase [Aspergillus pseudocaelatus]
MASISENLDKIAVTGDSRIRSEVAFLNGKSYGYLIAEPESGFDRTILLIHGFPDLSMGWRYQIPRFLELGFRVVCPDCLGYGRSDAPTDLLEPYTNKSQANDFHELCKSLGCTNVVVGAHDWGCCIAYRFALEYPSFVTHLFTLAIPYIPVSEKFISQDELVKFMPNLGYQLQWGSKEGIIESYTKDQIGIRNFLNAVYAGRTPDGELGVSMESGADLSILPTLLRSPLVSEDELDFYVREYSRNGLHGPCNYYRTRKANFEADRSLLRVADGVYIKCPVLFIRALGDTSATDELVAQMPSSIPNLKAMNVDASHWLLWEKPTEVNGLITEWMKDQGLVN